MNHSLSTLITLTLFACAEPPEEPPDEPEKVVCEGREELTADKFVGGASLPAFTCWSVPQSLTLASGTFTVEEGVDILFSTGVQVLIPTGAQLTLAGTEDAQILMHTGDPLITWKGISLEDSQGSDNVWSHTIIENAGDDQWNGASDSFGALWVEGSTSLSLDNVTFRGSPDYAMNIRGEEPNLSIETITFENNEKTAWVAVPNAEIFPTATTTTDNADNRIHIGASNGPNELSADATWSNVEGGWLILRDMYISAALEIMPGTTVQMAEATRIVVEDSGTLIAQGDEANPIIFEASSPGNKGFWTGIEVKSSGQNGPLDVGASFQYAEIRDAGHDQFTGASDTIASLFLRLEGSTEIADSVIANGNGYGLWATDDHDLVGFQNNTFTDNDVPARLAPNRVGELDGDSDFSDNIDARIHVGHSNGDEVDTDAQWIDPGVPLFLTEPLKITAALSLDEGMELQFDQSQYLHVFDSGSLSADGTETRPIRFVGQNPITSGYWRGLRFDSRDTNNKLTYSSILHAGVDQWNGNSNTTASIFLGEDALLTLVNTDVGDGAGYAFWLSDGYDLTCTSSDIDADSYDDENDVVVSGC